MRDKLILKDGEDIVLDRSRQKGTMAQTDIEYYNVVNQDKEIVGTVKYTDHTSLNGFSRTQHLEQNDSDGNLIVDISW